MGCVKIMFEPRKETRTFWSLTCLNLYSGTALAAFSLTHLSCSPDKALHRLGTKPNYLLFSSFFTHFPFFFFFYFLFSLSVFPKTLTKPSISRNHTALLTLLPPFTFSHTHSLFLSLCIYISHLFFYNACSSTYSYIPLTKTNFTKKTSFSSMDFNLENPLGNFHDLPSEALPSLFLIESDHIPPFNYCQTLKASDFDISVRRNVVSLISQVTNHQHQFTFIHKHKYPIFLFCFSKWFLACFLSLQLSCTFDPVLPYLAINYLDRFLANQGILVTSQTKQLVHNLLHFV